MSLIDYNFVSSFFECEKERGIECIICYEALKGNFTKYAHHKAQKESHDISNTYANNEANNGNLIDYVDYYMLFYRMKYTKLYSLLLEKYKNEYYNLLLEKFKTEKNLCEYHGESVYWYNNPKPEKIVYNKKYSNQWDKNVKKTINNILDK